MGAPPGNKHAKGNKGGGRKSAYQERADAQFLWSIFTDAKAMAELDKRVKSGRFSILDRMVLAALMGNERHISDIFKKLFPDNMVVSGNLQQKQVHELEEGIRDILAGVRASSKTANRTSAATESTAKALEDAVQTASRAIKKPKKKRVLVAT